MRQIQNSSKGNNVDDPAGEFVEEWAFSLIQEDAFLVLGSCRMFSDLPFPEW